MLTTPANLKNTTLYLYRYNISWSRNGTTYSTVYTGEVVIDGNGNPSCHFSYSNSPGCVDVYTWQSGDGTNWTPVVEGNSWYSGGRPQIAGSHMQFKQAYYGSAAGGYTAPYSMNFPSWTSSSAVAVMSCYGDSGTISGWVYAGNNTGGKDVVQYFDEKTQSWKTYKSLAGQTANYNLSIAYNAQFFADNPDIDPGDIQWRVLSYNSAGTLTTRSGLTTGSTVNVAMNPTDTTSPLGNYFVVTAPDSYAQSLLSTQAVQHSDGSTTWGTSSTGSVSNTSSNSVVDVTGTATDAVTAANTQTGIQRNLLSTSAAQVTLLQSIDSKLSTSSSGGSASSGTQDVSDAGTHDKLDKITSDLESKDYSAVDTSGLVSAESDGTTTGNAIASDLSSGATSGKSLDIPTPPSMATDIPTGIGQWNRKFTLSCYGFDVSVDLSYLDNVANLFRQMLKWAMQIVLWYWMVKTGKEAVA